VPANQHAGCRVVTEVMPSCHSGAHDECVHLVEDVVEEGLLPMHAENVLRVCTCDCHADCPVASTASESRVLNADARKDACTCWDTRHTRQGSAPVDHARDADPDDGPMVELSKGFSISRSCVIAAPILVLACVGGLIGVYASRGTVRTLLWLPTLALLVLTVPLILLLLAGFVPSLLHTGRQRHGAGLMVAALVAIGFGVVAGFGVVIAGPSDFATSALLAVFAFTIYSGRYKGRAARRLSPRVRHYVAAYFLLSAVVSAATGIALLT
jgi:hypothetical protein